MLNRILPLSLFLLVFICCQIHAEQVKAKATLVYGIPHYPPYSLVHKNSFSGRDVELVELLAEKLAVNIEFSPCDWIRCLELAKAGKVDILTAASYTPEREAYLHFIQPAYSIGYIAFWVRKGEANRLSRYQDLLTLNVGKEKAARLFKKVDENPDINIYESPDYQVLLKMLASGRLDTVMGGSLVLENAIAKSQLRDELEKAKFQHNVPSTYLVMSKNSPQAMDWLPELQQQMANMMQNGELDYFITWRDSSTKSEKKAH